MLLFLGNKMEIQPVRASGLNSYSISFSRKKNGTHLQSQNHQICFFCQNVCFLIPMKIKGGGHVRNAEMEVIYDMG